MTLPIESIGSPVGPVDILVRTASWGGGGSIFLPNDDLPNSGVVTLVTIPGDCPGDLDPDGDVDGRDLVQLAGAPASIDLAGFAMDFGKTTCK